MKIISKLKMDLLRPGSTPVIHAVQNDRNSRFLEFTLLEGGRPWAIPAGAAVLVRYRKLGGRGGEYNTLADGSPAGRIDGCRVTVALAPQVLTVPGTVELSVALVTQEQQISLFPVRLQVLADAEASAPEAEAYAFTNGFLPAPTEARAGQYLRVSSVSGDKKVTGVEAVSLSNSGAEIDTEQIRQIVEAYLEEMPDAGKAVSTHNTDAAAHQDLRLTLQDLSERINAALDSDDTTLDQLSELVSYIRDNRELIDSITTGKVSVSDIVDDLSTRISAKPLSAAQGVVLREMIEAISPEAIGAESAGTAAEQIAVHASDVSAHADIREELAQLASGQPSETSVPEFWEEAVEAVCDTVIELQALGGRDCVCFALCSDMHIHWPGETDTNYARNLGSITAAVMDRCHIPLLVNCGDLLTNTVYENERYLDKSYDQAWKYLAPVGAERLLLTAGNHDGAWGTSSDGSRYYVNNMDPNRLWQHLYRPQAADFRRVWAENGTCFYLDNLPQKVRFLCLNSHDCQWSENEDGSAVCATMANSGYTQAQLDFLISSLDVEEGWSIVLFSHVPPTAQLPIDYSGLRCYELVRGIASAYSKRSSYSGSYVHDPDQGEGSWADATVIADFSGAAGEIVGWFCGHCHRDAIVTGDLPFPIVTVTCAGNFSYDDSEADRTLGTATETAVDFVTLCKADRTIRTTRLGIGADRSVSYGTVYSVTNQLTDVSTDNAATSVAAGSSYQATLTPAVGSLTGVSVTMGGADITETAYRDGLVSIAAVTGDIVITATAESDDPFAFTKSNWSCSVSSAMTLNADSVAVLRGSSGENFITCNHRFTRKAGTYTFSVKGNGAVQNNAVMTAVQIFDADGQEITEAGHYVPNHSYSYNTSYSGFLMNTGYGSFTFTLSDSVASFRMKFAPGSIVDAGKTVTMSEFTLTEP